MAKEVTLLPLTSLADGWDATVARLSSPAPLHQSWAWGEAQECVGWPPERVALPSGGTAQVLLRGGTHFKWGYVPRGPVPATMLAIDELVAWARSRGLALLRVEPEGPEKLAEALLCAGFRRGPLIEARRTAIVTLRSDESMLASFRKSTRQNIRTAERHGIIVEEAWDTSELSRLVQLSARRHSVYITGADFHRALTSNLPDRHIYLARYRGEVLAAVFVAHHDGRAYYLIGGSSRHGQEVMPNYALQWHAMRRARAAGCLDYDLCGLPTSDDPHDPWQNLRQFKAGFGGVQVTYPGTWDIVLAPIRYQAMHQLHRARLRASRLLTRVRRLADTAR